MHHHQDESGMNEEKGRGKGMVLLGDMERLR